MSNNKIRTGLLRKRQFVAHSEQPAQLGKGSHPSLSLKEGAAKVQKPELLYSSAN